MKVIYLNILITTRRLITLFQAILELKLSKIGTKIHLQINNLLFQMINILEGTHKNVRLVADGE